MKWRGCPSVPILNYDRFYHHRRFHFTTFLRKVQTSQPRASAAAAGSNGSSSQGNWFVVPGATVATILMLGALHARRLYDDKKIEEARAKGVELEFHPDVKARFLRLLPLRSISRFWGSLTGMELPVWLRPHVYKAWARAFHSNLEEAQLPLEEYASLREFFVRRLKEGLRPIDSDSCCLVSPVDGTVMRFGELRGPGAMIEQVKGCSYSASSLLGANSFLPMIAAGDANEESDGEENTVTDSTQKSWWKISFASPKVRDTESSRPLKGLFYCVIYLKPGDYHRIHSPVDWNVLVRRHFTGHLFPMNDRATRTIRNLYVENERVVLEGQWQEGYMAMAAVGATNIGSIELFIEPTLRTNNPQKKLLPSEPPEERVYEPKGTGVLLKKGDEIAAFNMGSTVVLVFQAPISQSSAHQGSSSEFRFCIERGDRIRMGEALGRWKDS
ncbi:Phosphatidylserine decarboxylase proenzyme 1, mitochondrial [Sesamum alatum]|uniref:Phosphatidylserine decarboxylase proenzyme 1, mitochondrial n=1 Tax=Sesamum alatum TaxID=300844 RepID=A0AAE1YRP3_9LAMI|nr:Phosphatidylserine decarboxylase proenzyme 1, mitochondrial [Sesamum alatum]